MNATKEPVETVSEFVARAIGLCNDWGDKEGAASLWFRGVSKESYDLKPKLYRLEKFDEGEILIDFKRFAIQLVETKPEDDWEWYFLMQHYRAPTRLLDWTDGDLIAL